VHYRDSGNKNESEHWPSNGLKFFSLKIEVSCRYVNFIGFEDIKRISSVEDFQDAFDPAINTL
jgi:hypothetical protein